MQINNPDELMKAIKLLIVQMNRGQRKQFLMWMKKTRNEFDFKFPEGYKIPDKEFKENPNETTAEPVIAVPVTELVLPPGSSESGGINTGQGS